MHRFLFKCLFDSAGHHAAVRRRAAVRSINIFRFSKAKRTKKEEDFFERIEEEKEEEENSKTAALFHLS